MCLGLSSGAGANWHEKLSVYTAETFQLSAKGSYTQTARSQCVQVCAVSPAVPMNGLADC